MRRFGDQALGRTRRQTRIVRTQRRVANRAYRQAHAPVVHVGAGVSGRARLGHAIRKARPDPHLRVEQGRLYRRVRKTGRVLHPTLLPPWQVEGHKLQLEHDYRHLAGQVFSELQRRYGGARPGIRLDPKLHGLILYATLGKPRVRFSQQDAEAAFSGFRGARNFARSALVHEYAHTRQRNLPSQPGRRRRRQARIEGGAEEFARQNARRTYSALGLHVRPGSNELYRRFARWVRRHYGPGYATGQFK